MFENFSLIVYFMYRTKTDDEATVDHKDSVNDVFLLTQRNRKKNSKAKMRIST